ncbi:MAG: ABC transporter permease [Alphaproteobacteria bacterium]|nr:ABC transporter permease [Alphaproteobacteria bacterium]
MAVRDAPPRAQRPEAPPIDRGRLGRRFWGPLRDVILDNPAVFMAGILLAMWLILSRLSPHFFTVNNLFEITVQAAVIALIAIGQTFVILSAGIDLSVGAVLAAAAVTASLVMESGYGLTAGIAAALLCGAAFGAANGVAIGVLGIPPFVATLGMMGIARGYALIVTSGIPVFTLAEGFEVLGQGRVADVVPVPTLITLALYVLGFVILSRTRLGRYTYAIGSNLQATTFSGVNVTRYLIVIYSVSGITAAVAGLIEASRIGSGQPASGVGYELDSITAVVIGGTSLFGGQGNLFASLIGALIIATLRNGLNVLGVFAFWQMVAIGAILIAAVYLDRWRRRSRGE